MRRLLVILLFSFACGDNDPPPGPSPQPLPPQHPIGAYGADAGVDAR